MHWVLVLQEKELQRRDLERRVLLLVVAPDGDVVADAAGRVDLEEEAGGTGEHAPRNRHLARARRVVRASGSRSGAAEGDDS